MNMTNTSNDANNDVALKMSVRLKEIAELLAMKDISRMEAFDISHISGFASVGSMVVFEKGKPLRSDYRKFRLKTIEGVDDYASMREVLTRRFTFQTGYMLGMDTDPQVYPRDEGA